MLTAFKGPEAGHLVVVDEGGQVKRKRLSWIFFYKKELYRQFSFIGLGLGQQ